MDNGTCFFSDMELFNRSVNEDAGLHENIFKYDLSMLWII